MNEQNLLDFENYLVGSMSIEEKNIFENKLQLDAALNTDFSAYKETSKFVETKFSSETAAFKDNLKVISKSNFDETTTKKPKVISLTTKYLAIAASLVLMIGTYFFMQNNVPTYNDYNQHENASFGERGVEEPAAKVAKVLKKAQIAFNEKRFQDALPYFETVLKVDNKPEINYFYAICLIETENYLKAEDVLMTIKDGKSVYKDRATWYLALMRLKQKSYQSCKNLLKQIPAEAEDYTKAQELQALLKDK